MIEILIKVDSRFVSMKDLFVYFTYLNNPFIGLCRHPCDDFFINKANPSTQIIKTLSYMPPPQGFP